jgi:hypothetical protein
LASDLSQRERRQRMNAVLRGSLSLWERAGVRGITSARANGTFF